MLHLNDQNFEKEILTFGGIALVDFFAAWCGPCQMLGPILEDVDKEIGAKFKICKVDVDQAPAAAEKYGVMSVPTLIIFKNGEAVETMNGVRSKEVLIEKLESLNQ
ncbi:MAG: thioredoxin [Parcubacteria group bacterium]